MERTFIEIEREAYKLRSEFIREIAGQFGRFLKRKFEGLVSGGSNSSAAEVK